MEEMKFVLEFSDAHDAVRVLEKLMAEGDLVIKLKDKVYVVSDSRELYVTVSFVGKTKTLDIEVAEHEGTEVSA